MKVITSRNKFLSELQRFISIISYSVDSFDSYEHALANSQNPEEDKKIVEVLEKSSEKLDKEAESFVKHIGVQSKFKKTKQENVKNSESNLTNIISNTKTQKKSNSISKSSEKDDEELEH